MTPIAADETYELTNDSARVEVTLVHRWLSEQSYWAHGRSRATVQRSIDGSRCYSAFATGSATQVAFARVVTDDATFAWVCDVFVDAAHRGRGLGRRLVATAVAEVQSMGVPRVLLATRDAHAVYRPLGFEALADPGKWMLIDTRAL